MARGYAPDEGIYVASEGARHAYLHKDTGLNVDVFADELYFCHRIPSRTARSRPPDHLDHGPAAGNADRRIQLKDFKDTVVLMLEHPLSNQEAGPKAIDVAYITDMMRQDWASITPSPPT